MTPITFGSTRTTPSTLRLRQTQHRQVSATHGQLKNVRDLQRGGLLVADLLANAPIVSSFQRLNECLMSDIGRLGLGWDGMEDVVDRPVKVHTSHHQSEPKIVQ